MNRPWVPSAVSLALVIDTLVKVWCSLGCRFALCHVSRGVQPYRPPRQVGRGEI